MTDIKILQDQAKGCSGCGEWTHICKAECCSGFVLSDPTGWATVKKGDVIRFVIKATPSERWYYKLHNATLNRGILTFRLDNFKVDKNFLHVLNRCSALTEDLKCSLHPNKPKVCKEFTQETYGKPDFSSPELCLFRFKEAV